MSGREKDRERERTNPPMFFISFLFSLSYVSNTSSSSLQTRPSWTFAWSFLFHIHVVITFTHFFICSCHSAFFPLRPPFLFTHTHTRVGLVLVFFLSRYHMTKFCTNVEPLIRTVRTHVETLAWQFSFRSQTSGIPSISI